jgi:hypothetical protein
MVSDATWADIDGDDRKDLVIVGEYSPVNVYLNKEDRFDLLESEPLINANGLWRSMEIVDLDQDGDLDILLGNIGKNNLYNISPETPLLISTSDVDQNGSVDPLILNFQKSKNGEWDMYPAQFWDNLTQQSPLFRQEFGSYKSFSRANFDYYKNNDLIVEDELLKAKYDASLWVENIGEGTFEIKPLPESLQLGPINDFLTLQEGDDLTIFMVGNDFGGPPFEGNMDAFQGSILQFKEGSLITKGSEKSGFHVFGDARALDKVRLSNGKDLILVTQNQGSLLAFEKRTE